MGCIACAALVLEGDGVTLERKEPSTIPVEADSICPDRFVGLGQTQIEALPVFYGRRQVRLGDLFTVEGAGADTITVRGDLKAVMRFLDHKMLVTEQDATFLNPDLFEPEGVVLLKGKGPSVENVALYVWDNVVKHIGEKFPGHDITYTVEVLIQETENNIFVVSKDVKV